MHDPLWSIGIILYAMHYRSIEPCMDPRLYLKLYSLMELWLIDSMTLCFNRTIVP